MSFGFSSVIHPIGNAEATVVVLIFGDKEVVLIGLGEEDMFFQQGLQTRVVVENGYVVVCIALSIGVVLRLVIAVSMYVSVSVFLAV
jgi:hypothetical protein